MGWQPYFHDDPNIPVGKHVVRGTRLAVDFLLGLYAAGWSEAQRLENSPALTPEALRAIHAFAAERVRVEERYALPTA